MSFSALWERRMAIRAMVRLVLARALDGTRGYSLIRYCKTTKDPLVSNRYCMQSRTVAIVCVFARDGDASISAFYPVAR